MGDRKQCYFEKVSAEIKSFWGPHTEEMPKTATSIESLRIYNLLFSKVQGSVFSPRFPSQAFYLNKGMPFETFFAFVPCVRILIDGNAKKSAIKL